MVQVLVQDVRTMLYRMVWLVYLLPSRQHHEGFLVNDLLRGNYFPPKSERIDNILGHLAGEAKHSTAIYIDRSSD